MSRASRILLIDDHAVIRGALHRAFALQPDFEVVAEAGEIDDAMELLTRTSPDLVLMDLVMPGLEAVEAIPRIAELAPSARVVVLTELCDEARLERARAAGAAACVCKSATFETLLAVLRDLVAKCPGDLAKTAEGADEQLHLSPREGQVLQGIARGVTSKEIAIDLGISERTVETYRERLRDKLGLHSIAELTSYAIRKGLVSPD